VVAAVLALVLHGGHAHAAPAPTALGDVAIAEEFWGGPPTQCTSLAIGFAPIPGAGGDATQPAPGWSGPCEMQLSEVGTVTATGRVITPEIACVIVIHEEGHLHGLGHSTNPTSVMQADPWATPVAVMAPVCAEPGAPVTVAAPPVVEPPPSGVNVITLPGGERRMPHAHPWHHPRRHRSFWRGQDIPAPARIRGRG
jgi:hypothetical protein